MLRGDDFRAERHHRLQAQLLGVLVGKRRAAVQHDARPHPRAAHLRKTDQRGRIRERPAGGVERLHHLLEPVELPLDSARAVGVQRHRQRTDGDERGRGWCQHHPDREARRPSRRDVDSARGREADRIGLVAFAGDALTQIPVTLDYAVLTAAVAQLQVGILADGTAIGSGLATAVNRLRRVPAKSRVVLLLTDGVNNRGAIDPRTAADAAASFGVKVYTVGVGTQGEARIPTGRGLSGFRYETLPVEIDEALLRRNARALGAVAALMVAVTVLGFGLNVVSSYRYVAVSAAVPGPAVYQVALVVRVMPASWKRNGVSMPLPPVRPA